MILAPLTGTLAEPLTGRRWEPADVAHEVGRRVSHYRARGIRPRDRVLLGYGNRLEFFADLLALWTTGACAIPLDARLTPFEIETLETLDYVCHFG